MFSGHTQSIQIDAPAKLNLFLELHGRRPDGYHDLETVMIAINRFDRTCIGFSETGTVQTTCSWEPHLKAISQRYGDTDSGVLDLPDSQNNLVTRALQAFRDAYRIEAGFRVTLKKTIPAGAGMGGASGSLSNQQRELIALAVGEANQCDYCLAAHSALGKMAGLSLDQIRDARQGSTVDAKSDSLIRFAHKLVGERGHVSGEDLQALRDQGFSDGDITEVVANVALNIFTNYFNHVADPDIDFPQAESLACKVA